VALVIALLSLLLSSVTFAFDPVGIVEIPHDAKLPSRSYVEFPVGGYRGEEPTLELLVWRKGGTASKPTYAVRDASGAVSWIEPERSEYRDLEETLEDDEGVILDPLPEWRRLRVGPEERMGLRLGRREVFQDPGAIRVLKPRSVWSVEEIERASLLAGPPGPLGARPVLHGSHHMTDLDRHHEL
jgi:hypothetical protein